MITNNVLYSFPGVLIGVVSVYVLGVLDPGKGLSDTPELRHDEVFKSFIQKE